MEGPVKLCAGIPFIHPPTIIAITSGASLLGWGTHLCTQTVQGKWSSWESLPHFKLLHFRTVRHPYIHFLAIIKSLSIKVITNNLATFFMNCQGGVNSLLFVWKP